MFLPVQYLCAQVHIDLFLFPFDSITNKCNRYIYAMFAYFRDKNVVNKYFLSVFVRLFLEKKEKALMRFISDFQKLTVSDEKVS